MSIATWALMRREIFRVMRISRQTIFPSVITTILYFAIFGFVLGERVGDIDGLPYSVFVASGLVMLAVTVNSYSNTAFSVYIEKFNRAFEELLASPLSDHQIIWGFVSGGVFRGVMCALAVWVTCLFFIGFQMQHPIYFMLAVILSSIVFSLLGMANGLVAQSFDGLNVVATLILSPLTMLGGVFYSVTMLPAFWQGVAWFNPLLYIGNLFRFAMSGATNIQPDIVLGVLVVLMMILYAVSYGLMKYTHYVRQ